MSKKESNSSNFFAWHQSLPIRSNTPSLPSSPNAKTLPQSHRYRLYTIIPGIILICSDEFAEGARDLLSLWSFANIPVYYDTKIFQ